MKFAFAFAVLVFSSFGFANNDLPVRHALMKSVAAIRVSSWGMLSLGNKTPDERKVCAAVGGMQSGVIVALTIAFDQISDPAQKAHFRNEAELFRCQILPLMGFCDGEESIRFLRQECSKMEPSTEYHAAKDLNEALLLGQSAEKHLEPLSKAAWEIKD